MRKLSLAEWASISEIVGMVAVIISLIFVVVSLERNTAAATASVNDEAFQTVRELNLSLLNNPELFDITIRAAENPDGLTGSDREKYKVWIHVHLDMWERYSDWEETGLIEKESVESWNEYFYEWTRRHLTKALWEEIRWQYTGERFRDRIDSIMRGD